MNELLPASVGLGLFVSLLFTDVFGLATGGLIVPGYVALCLERPCRLLTTVLAAVLTFAVVRMLSQVMILYGRRRVALNILVGYMSGAALQAVATHLAQARSLAPLARIFGAPGSDAVVVSAAGSGAAASAGLGDGAVIGHVIVGLLATGFERQGIVATCCAVWAAAVVVRLLLVVVSQGPWVF